MEADETLKLAVTGHVDHGKSTVIGRLLYDAGAWPAGAVEKVRRLAREEGRPFEFAHLLDALEEERRQGVTIDTTQVRFRGARRDYLIIDAPGHREFLKNMISGAAEAEAAFLVVDAARGVEEQSRRHAFMLSLLGVRRIGVLVNKMDLVGYGRPAFEKIRGEMDAFLSSLDLEAGLYVPLSALAGENILRPSALLPWYDGPTLMAALEGLPKERSAADRPARLPIQDVYKFDDRRIVAGRLESGRLAAGDEIVVSPGGQRTTIKALAHWREKDRRGAVVAGESVGLILADEFFNRRGDVISSLDDRPATTDFFRASLFWMGRRPLRPGRKYKLKLASQETEAEISAIYKKIDAVTLAEAAGAAEVGPNEAAEAAIKTRRPLALDLFSRQRATGRFVLLDGYDVAGGGIVVDTEGGDFSGFVNGPLRVRGGVFEEYYYSVGDREVRLRPAERRVFAKGDPAPLKGRGYEYPEFFDIVVFPDQAAVKIRAGLIHDILPLEGYEYGGLPVVDGRGFAFRLSSADDWRRAMRDFAGLTPQNEAALSERWLNFGAFRRIPFSDGDWTI